MQTENLLDGQCAKPSHRGKVDEDVEEEPEDGECKTHTIVITFAKELRNGEDTLLEHDGQEELANHNKSYGCHDLVSSNGDAVGKASSGHADELLGRDVGGNE